MWDWEVRFSDGEMDGDGQAPQLFLLQKPFDQ